MAVSGNTREGVCSSTRSTASNTILRRRMKRSFFARINGGHKRGQHLYCLAQFRGIHVLDALAWGTLSEDSRNEVCGLGSQDFRPAVVIQGRIPEGKAGLLHLLAKRK